MNEAIIERLKSEKYDFTNYELDYIHRNDSYQITFINNIDNLKCKWDEKLFNVVYYYVDFEKICLNENILFNFLLAQIEYKPNPRNLFIDNVEFINNLDRKKYVINKYNSKLQDKEFISSIQIEENDITYLLDNKMYKSLSYIKKLSKYYKISLDTVTRINKEYPFDLLPFPKFLFAIHDRIYLKMLDKLTIPDLFLTLTEKRLFEKDITYIKEVLFKRIETCSSLEYEDFSYLFLEDNYSIFKKRFTEEELKSLAKELFNKNCVLLYEYLDRDDNANKKIENLIIKSNEQLELFIINPAEEVYISKTIIDKLIQSGKYNYLMEFYYNSSNEKLKKFLYLKLTKQIIMDPSPFALEFSFISTGSIIDKKILGLILDTGYVKKIFINDKSEYQDIIYPYIDKRIIKNIDFPLNSLKNVEKYFYLALQNSNLELLYNLITNNGLTNRFYDILYKFLYKKEIVDFLGKFVIDKIIAHENILNYYIVNNLYIIEILDYIRNNKTKDYILNEHNYNLIKHVVSNYYNIEVTKMDIIEKEYGPTMLLHFDNPNIHELFDLTRDNLYRLIELFKKQNYTLADLESAVDSIKQYEFSTKNPVIFDMCNNIIMEVDPEILNAYALELARYIDDKCYKKIIEKYNIDSCEFKNKLMLIIKTVYNVKNDGLYLSILHDLVNYYLLKKREEHRLTYKDNLYNELNVPFVYDEKNILDEGANYALNNMKIPINNNKTFYEEIMNKINNDNISLNKIEMKLLKKYAKEIIFDNLEFFKKHYLSKFDNKLRKEYFIENNEVDIFNNILKLNFSRIKSSLENDEIYKNLLKITRTKKILYWPDFLKKYLKNNSSELKYSDNNEINFLNYFSNIYAKEKNNKEFDLSVAMILKYECMYNGISSVYSQILGQEDAELIKLNPGTLHAHLKTENNVRLIEACELTINNFQRKYVAVPSINQVFEYNGKKMRVVVGNFTHPHTLTHGERTNSCMRIGGIGESLYNFALTCVNGFHIVLLDSQTEEYISRATAFVNGNSIFINGLRYSLNYDKYSDYELAKILQLAMQEEIKLSTHAINPIDNVFAYDGYAITDLNYLPVSLKVDSIKENMKGFYTDISTNAVVLATREKKYNYKPIKFTTCYDNYLVSRYDVKKTNKLYEVYSIFNRIHSVNTIINMMKENNPDKIDSIIEYVTPLNIENGFIEGYYNYDWYVYIDNNYNINMECIQTDIRAIEEMEHYKEKLEKKYVMQRKRTK